MRANPLLLTENDHRLRLKPSVKKGRPHPAFFDPTGAVHASKKANNGQDTVARFIGSQRLMMEIIHVGRWSVSSIDADYFVT